MCGVFGVYGSNSCITACGGASAQEHRGKDGVGLAGLNIEYQRIRRQRGLGTARDVLNFSRGEVQRIMDSDMAMTHTRYPTAGSNIHEEVQPHLASTARGKIALCSNGDLVNVAWLNEQTRTAGMKVEKVNNDAAAMVSYVAMLIEKRGMTISDAIANLMENATGSFSAMLFAEFDENMYFFRDRFGIRPYEIGHTPEGNTICASEWGALNDARAQYNGSVGAGHLLVRYPNNEMSAQIIECPQRAFCVFEIIYLSRPDSRFYYDEAKGLYVSYEILREEIGRRVAKEHKINADVVIGVPRSGIPGALGYASEMRIPCQQGIIVNPLYVAGRTFITDSYDIRSALAMQKYILIEDVFRGRDVIIYDDSTIKGLTMSELVDRARKAGARKISVVVGSPPIRNICYLGIETKKILQLIAREGNVEQARRRIKSPDKLAYTSIEGLFSVIQEKTGLDKSNFCSGCLDSIYPISRT